MFACDLRFIRASDLLLIYRILIVLNVLTYDILKLTEKHVVDSFNFVSKMVLLRLLVIVYVGILADNYNGFLEILEDQFVFTLMLYLNE